MKPILVESTAALEAAAKALAGAPRFHIDTEFLAGPGEKKLALVQVSRGGDEVWLIDTMRLSALGALAPVLGRPDAEWVLHAGRQDVELLQAALGLAVAPRVFDTQVAWGLLGPEYPVALAYLQYRVLGLRSSKSEQAVDWTRRPLSPEQIDYAAGDVAHLPAIREALGERLRAKGREDLVLQASSEAVLSEPDRPLGLDGFRNAWQLDGPGLAVLKHLIDAHNALPPAERAWGLPPQAFLQVAKVIPETAEEFLRLRGVPAGWVRRFGAATASAIVRVSAQAAKEPFTPLEPPPYATWEGIRAEGRVRDWIARTCEEREASPDLLFPSRLVAELCRHVAGGGEVAGALGGWRRALLG